MGPLHTVVSPPSLQHGERVRKRAEQGLVKQFVAQAAMNDSAKAFCADLPGAM
jgi:hypothetical protein